MVPPNKAIVGDYGFAHESGIHTCGVLNDSWTYEPYPPELVGNARRLTIGKQSGKNMIKHKIFELIGKEPSDETVAIIVDKVKDIYANGRRASLKEDELKKYLNHSRCYPKSATATDGVMVRILPSRESAPKHPSPLIKFYFFGTVFFLYSLFN